MNKLKELYGAFVNLTKSNVFIWSYPTIALTMLFLFPFRVLGLIFLGIWVLALINNSDEKG